MRLSTARGYLRLVFISSISSLALAAALPASANPLLQSDALDFDERRGVLTMAPLLKTVRMGVVSINTVDSEEADGTTVGGLGSGVIIDAARGYVVTNAHVIAGSREIRVTLADRRRFDAITLGSDPDTDLALIRVLNPEGLTALSIDEDDDTEVGDFVIAIGNPYGLSSSVTSGIVSATGRESGDISSYTDHIQTDASINPGNSGGALLNTAGEVVGINASLLTRDGGNSGIGFAIPASTVRNVTRRLQQFGKVERGRIGVMIRAVPSDRMAELGLPDLKGALIDRVDAGTPASTAGLQTDDVITHFGERELEDNSDLRHAVGLYEPGEDVIVRYRRNGTERTTRIRVGQPPTIKTASRTLG